MMTQAEVLEARRPSESSLCVPTTMSTVPSARPSSAGLISFARAEARHLGDLRPASCAKRSANVW
jgi:hypothetical protein